MEDVKAMWVRILTEMIDSHRRENPNDLRTDTELLNSMAPYLFKKGENGKWIMPRIDDPEDLLRRLRSDLQ